MKKYLFLSLFIAFCSTAISQTKAITQYGKTVTLYDDGTWKYDVMQSDDQTTEAVAKANVTEAKTTATKVNLNELNGETKFNEFTYDVSKRLSRYFGDVKGQIKVNTAVKANNGEVFLNFRIENTIADSHRYFGYPKEAIDITFEAKNRDSIKLTFDQDLNYEVIEKFNFSFYTFSTKLNSDQVEFLMQNDISEITIDWKKTTETYKIDNKSLIKEELNELK